MIFVSIDVESSGINDSQILEFGAIIEDTKLKLPYEDIPKFRAKFWRNGFISGQIQGVLMNAGLLKEILENPKDCWLPGDKELGKTFRQWLINNGIKPDETNDVIFNVAGKNFFGFDYPMINEQTKLFEYAQPSRRVLDPSILYANWTSERLPGLQDCLNKAGIEKNVSHTSLEDAFDVIQLLRKFY